MNNIDRIFSKDIELFSKAYFEYLKQIMDNLDRTSIREFVELLMKARLSGASIFFIGNGGSAATASHFANDLAFGTQQYKKPFRVMSLTDNVAVLTALGNDCGYENIYLRQLMIYGKPGDILVGISASGNSNNIVKTFEYAHETQIDTVAITAFDGGALKKIANHSIHVDTMNQEYGPAEDIHMILDHLIGAYLLRALRDE